MSHRLAGGVALAGALVVFLSGVSLAPNGSRQQFRDYLYAPPMRVHLVDQDGRLRWPFVYPLTLVDRLERHFEEDRSRRRPLVWFTSAGLVHVSDPENGPLLLLGADPLGRDVFARLVHGAQASLGVALASALVALVAGSLIGAAAGVAGGVVDEVLMRVADFFLVLPALYVVLALRAATPLVLSGSAVFGLMTGVFAVVGWPYVARGVRAIVRSESRQDYAQAAVAVGVGPVRLLARHILPAAYPFLAVQATLLVPGFILAEATLSFVGLGFTDPTPSWGVMLQEASNIRAIADFPWLLSPAVAIFLVVLALNLLLHDEMREPLPLS